jgi:hypothetical protein
MRDSIVSTDDEDEEDNEDEEDIEGEEEYCGNDESTVFVEGLIPEARLALKRLNFWHLLHLGFGLSSFIRREHCDFRTLSLILSSID